MREETIRESPASIRGVVFGVLDGPKDVLSPAGRKTYSSGSAKFASMGVHSRSQKCQ